MIDVPRPLRMYTASKEFSPLDPARWKRVEQLYHDALELDPAGRSAFLAAECATDTQLLAEVERMVAAGTDGQGFLDGSALQVAARSLADVADMRIGRQFGPYRTIAKLGSGGAGDVFLAVDSRLERQVAIKALPAWGNSDGDGAPSRSRVLHEARVASSLHHPNIVTIFDIIEEPDCDALVMEYINGPSLEACIAAAGGPLPVSEALRYTCAIASALEAAHSAGIVHRDIKPANILIENGQAKVLDFGIALTIGENKRDPGTGSRNRTTAGTVNYMSPEQAAGAATIDPRSDLFSLGTTLYEMLTGHRPFERGSRDATLDAIRHDAAPLLRTVRPDAPRELERIVQRCLEKEPANRYQTAATLRHDLEHCQQRMEAARKSIARRWWVQVPALAVAAAACWWGYHAYQVRWLRTVALPEIARLVDGEHYLAAYRMAQIAARRLPDHVELTRVRRDLWVPITIVTDPPGAEVFIRDYAGVNDPWEPLGKSPVEKLRLPAGDFRVRVSKPGFDDVEGTVDQVTRLFSRKLTPRGTGPEGMVWIPVDTFSTGQGKNVKAAPFWLDRFEVSNRQFQRFVDAGGYRDATRWWPDGTTPKLIASFVDSTGAAGPATWANGHFPFGKDDDAAGGVSWYEASAYAAFAGKSLPTSAHWQAAANFAHFSTILKFSNMGTEGPARTGLFQGLGRYGTYDMAGNVTEWCSNRIGGNRIVRGGSWRDPYYMYMTRDAADPANRDAVRGFRCAVYPAGPPPAELTGELHDDQQDFRSITPVDDTVFRSFRSFYEYDHTALNAKVEMVDDAYPGWRREKVTFDAAYGTDERVVVYLFLPRPSTSQPPFQSVILFPGGASQRENTSDNLELRRVDFLLRGGRAIVYPIYKGMHERNQATGKPVTRGPKERRDIRAQWLKDLSRTIDYLETRADFDTQRIAYFGASLGGDLGAIGGALEPRIKVLVLQACGLGGLDLPPEAQLIHFLPRVRKPVLMINGRYDFLSPLEENQNVMFRLFGTPAADKRHAVIETGHSVPRADVIAEAVPWLDRYLGPVRR